MASCSAAYLEAPTERSVAKDLHVHGFSGGQQVTTMLSVPIAKAPLMPPTATTWTAHYAEHDSKSTHVADCSSKLAASSPVLGTLAGRRASSQCYRRPWPASQRRAFSDLLTGSGAVWSACTRIPHPSGPRQGSPVSPETNPAWMIASDRAPSSNSGPLHVF